VLSHCAVDKENLHRILLQVLRSRRDNASSPDSNCPLLDAATSLDISDAVMSADLVSILIAALTTTAPCKFSLLSQVKSSHIAFNI